MARTEWLTDEDDEPEVGTIVAQRDDDTHWVHGIGPKPWISANGQHEDWETLAGELGPVRIVAVYP